MIKKILVLIIGIVLFILALWLEGWVVLTLLKLFNVAVPHTSTFWGKVFFGFLISAAASILFAHGK